MTGLDTASSDGSQKLILSPVSYWRHLHTGQDEG